MQYRLFRISPQSALFCDWFCWMKLSGWLPPPDLPISVALLPAGSPGWLATRTWKVATSQQNPAAAQPEPATYPAAPN